MKNSRTADFWRQAFNPLVALIVMQIFAGCVSMPKSTISDRSEESNLGLQWETFDPGTLSPDGKTMYFTWSITGIPQVWKVIAPMHFPEPVTGAPCANQIWATTPDGESLIVIRKSLARNSRSGVVVLSRSTGSEVVVPNELACDLKPVWVTNDNQKIYYLCYEDESNQTSIFSYALDATQSETAGHVAKRERIFKEDGHWSVADVQNDQSFLLKKSKDSRDFEFYEWSPPNEKVLHRIMDLPSSVAGSVRFTRYQGELLYFEAATNQFYLAKGAQTLPLELKPALQAKVRAFTIDHRRMHLYVETSNETLKVFDLHFDSQSADLVPLPELEALRATHVIQTSRYDRYVILNGKSAAGGMEQIVYDWKERKPTQWLPSITAALPSMP